MDIADGVHLFNNEKYFEAHDYFEDLWMNTGGDNKEFFQGLVQISVASFHLISQNYEGASSQYSKGLEKLEKYPDSYESINLLKLRKEIKILTKQIFVFFSKKSFKLEVTKIPFIELNINKT